MLKVDPEKILVSALRFSQPAIIVLLLFVLFSAVTQIGNCRKQAGLLLSQKGMLRDLKAKEDKARLQDAAISRILGNDAPADLLLKELSEKAPATVALTEMSLDRARKTLVLRGKTSVRPQAAQVVLADFISSLKQSDIFENASLVKLEKSVSDPEGLPGFEIICSVK